MTSVIKWQPRNTKFWFKCLHLANEQRCHCADHWPLIYLEDRRRERCKQVRGEDERLKRTRDTRQPSWVPWNACIRDQNQTRLPTQTPCSCGCKCRSFSSVWAKIWFSFHFAPEFLWYVIFFRFFLWTENFLLMYQYLECSKYTTKLKVKWIIPQIQCLIVCPIYFILYICESVCLHIWNFDILTYLWLNHFKGTHSHCNT